MLLKHALALQALLIGSLLLVSVQAAIFRPAAMIHSIAPHAGDDVIAEWAAEDFDFEEDEDELHAHLSPPRRRHSFFSSVLDDSRRAAWRIQDEMSEAGDRAADWYEYEKAQARDWLGRVKHSAAKVTDRMADELSAGYHRAKGKASGAYHDAASEYYRTKADLRSAGRSMDEWKHRIQDAVTSSVDDPVAEEVERVKMRQWMREVERALETEPEWEPQHGFRPRSWLQRASSEAEDTAEEAYQRGRHLYNQARNKAEDTYWRAKEATEDAAQRVKRSFWGW